MLNVRVAREYCVASDNGLADMLEEVLVSWRVMTLPNEHSGTVNAVVINLLRDDWELSNHLTLLLSLFTDSVSFN